MSRNPIAFLSYVRLDDQHESGRLTQFRDRLSGEVRMQTGEAFDIFQDRNDIAWGQQWQSRIEESIDAVTFLIPVITPSFFKSPRCMEELERFLKRETELGRTDLILPLYYVECPELRDEGKREQNQMAKAIASRQFADWRELRFEPFTSPTVSQQLAKMARQLANALERSQAEGSHSTTRPVSAAADTVRPSHSRAGSESEGVAAPSQSTVGPTPKTEPPTLIVDALHRGDHSTIGDALKAAKPGTRILVRPGLYKEGLVINKAVEIVGYGPLADVVIEASGKDVVLFQASMGRVANLTLRQMGSGDFYCVDIAQGRLDLEDCDITSQSLACVAIHDGADPRIRRNRIHGGKQSGVYVYKNGMGTLEDNEIFATTFSGVEIKAESNPTLRRNRIHDTQASGIYVYENGLGTFEDNEIFANALPGVSIKSGANPTLRRNRIHDGLQTGIYVWNGGLGTLEDNDIIANAGNGVTIAGGSNPTLRRNQITKNKFQGISIEAGGGGVIEDNDLRENEKGAWFLAVGPEATVKRARNRE